MSSRLAWTYLMSSRAAEDSKHDLVAEQQKAKQERRKKADKKEMGRSRPRELANSISISFWSHPWEWNSVE